MKLKIFTFLYSIPFTLLTSFGQDNNLLWAQGRGSVDFEMTRDLIVDGIGNVITVGQFSNTIDFDNGPGTYNLTSQGGTDIFVMKQDPNGNLIWARSFGDYDSDAGWSVGVDDADNIYITGVFRYEVDFDPSSAEYILGTWGSNAGQIFLLKLNSDGNLVWVNQMGTTSGTSQGLELDVEYNGATVIAGTFNGTVDFDPSAGTANMTANTTTNYDIFIARYDVDGGYQWALQMNGTSGNNFPGDITIGSDFSVYLTGTYGGDIDLDPTAGTQIATSNGYDEAFIIKLTSGGTFLWGKSFGGIYGESANAVITDSNDDVYIGGSFNQDVDFDPGPGTEIHSAGTFCAYILKLDWSGAFVNVKTINNGYSTVNAFAIDENQFLYVTGGFSNTIDIDPGVGVTNLTSVDNFDDVFVLQLNTSGNYVWANSYGAVGDDAVRAIEFNAQDDYYLGGHYNNAIDFNPNGAPYTLTGAGSNDFFVAKFGTCNIDLTVNQSGITLSSAQSGATYQWLNCNDNSEIAGAISQNFTPTADGNYACEVTYGSCVDTTTCTSITGVGINESESITLKIYPNPTNGIVNIETSESIELIRIYNSNGELVLVSQSSIINFETFVQGLYFVEVITTKGTVHTSVIKQ